MDEDKESRYKSMLSKLQRQVEDGQKALRSLRTAHTAELASRNELQTFLRRCIDDVRQDMAERGRSATLRRAASASRSRSSNGRGSTMPPPPLDPRQIPLAEFTPQDRINVMEWLLSQDQVIFMLYERMFPQAAAHPGATAAAAAQQQQDFGNDSGQIEAGAPGSLFYAPQHWSRPASSPGQKAGYVSSIHSSSSSQQQQRPQTVGPGSTRAGGASLPSVPASSGPSAGSSARLAGQPQSQYEKPSRPLSGFDAMRSGGALQTASGGGGDSARAKRPHTAHPTSSSSQRASSAQQQQQQQQHHLQHASGQGLTAEERAEDEYQRQQRALETGGGGADVRDEDEDDEDGDNELATDGTRGAGLGELDPLSDDEEDGEDGQGS
jgi:hypothetical protein